MMRRILPLSPDFYHDKANRTLGSDSAPAKFTATLAGAIQAVTINGTVTL